MFSQKINVTELKDSVRTIIFDAHNMLLENFKSMDFEKIVGSALKKCGYVYNLDVASGDFVITAAPGYYICAKWSGELYDINVEINQSGLSVNSIDVFWNGCTLSTPKLTLQLFLISPYAIENYKPVFDKLIEGLRAEYAKYESATKGDMGAKLLKSMIAPFATKNKLTGIKVEKNDEDSTLFILVKRVCNNVYLRTPISFDNYQDAVIKMVKAYNSIPDWIRDCMALNIHNYVNYPYGYLNYGYRYGERRISNLEGMKMSYGTLPPFDDSVNGDFTDTPLSKNLDALGYIYYVDESGNYNIFLNESLLLCRNNNSVSIRYIPEKTIRDSMIIEEADFILLLKMITWGCSQNGYFIDSPNQCQILDILVNSIQMALPKSLLFKNLTDGIAFFDYNNRNYRVVNKSSGWLKAIYHIVNELISQKNICEYIVFDDIETMFKEYDGKFSVLKL